MSVRGEPTVDVDVLRLKLEAGDRVLLCSDGLTEVVGDEVIEHEIGTRVDFRRAAPAHRDECTMKRASLKG